MLILALKISEEIKAYDLVSKTEFYLYQYYKLEENFNEAIKHLELHIQHEKYLHKNTVSQKVLNIEVSYKAEEAKKEADAVRQKNEELTKLNKEIEEQKKKLEDALKNLKAAQAQLIQSEKMASLGELTAGIAHEIQNPLNFVNNFSEVNTELIDEAGEEINKGNIDGVKNILNDIRENEEKINHHGKRADAIVKGMLQHSQKSSGQKQPTDINALCEEYLRLSYHGLKAKDKDFNATMKADFDSSLEKINIIPQDIGRVLLNLFNNAFYAVNEKKKTPDENYQPTVSVHTKKIKDKIEIVVKDNGNGIPQKIVDKIFQPFFTTKPTGQGTGLGLSLSYDIIKAHGGEIKVETKVDEGNPDKFGKGEGTIFIIQLPVV
ncbi:MAG: ATP-binding protein [Parafilimonas sp.]